MLSYSNLTTLGREEKLDELPQVALFPAQLYSCCWSTCCFSCQQFLWGESMQLMCNHKIKIHLTLQHQGCEFRSPLGRKIRISFW